MKKVLDNNIQETRRIIFYALISFFVFGLFARNFGLHKNFCYVVEAFSVILLFRYPFKINQSRLEMPFVIMIILFITSLLGVLINGVSPFNYIFGFRGQFLTMVFMFASAAYLSIKDYHRIFHLLYKFQYVNIVFAILQLVVFNASADANNGAFLGGATQDIFCGALMTYFFYAYNQKLVKFHKLLLVLTSCFFIAIIEDEKFIFVEAGVILIYFSVANGLNTRKLITAFLLLVAIVLGFRNLSEGQADTLGGANNILDYSQTAGWGYGLPRVGSSVIIQKMFFDNPVKMLFGVGLGQGVETKLSFIDSSFYEKYGYLTYQLFSFQNVFLQTGWLGTIFYVGFFVSLLLYNFMRKKKAPAQYKYLYDMAITFTLLCTALIWYNQSLRIYFGIFPYFILGLGPCVTRQLMQKKLIDMKIKKINKKNGPLQNVQNDLDNFK
jgi:hypothetical protein